MEANGNLIPESWHSVDTHELRLWLNDQIGGPGQYDGRPNELFLPLAGKDCRIVLVFDDNKIVSIKRGPAFEEAQWAKVQGGVERLIFAGPQKIGREFSFSSFRVSGYWQGQKSQVQILPAPSDAPQAPDEIAEHPFVLEYPIQNSDFWPITNYRRIRQHAALTLLLNVLLVGRTSFLSAHRQTKHFWASIPRVEGNGDVRWVQQFYFAKLGSAVVDELSPIISKPLQEIDPDTYYTTVGQDGRGLRVPADLDQSIWTYLQLPDDLRFKFDLGAYWMDMASKQWNDSFSASFSSLVSAVEAFTERGAIHTVYCSSCSSNSSHESPGATERFRDFFEKFAPGEVARARRSEMYKLRSKISHGGDLMQIDRARSFGWDPPGWNEDQLHRELWSVTRFAIRNWLKRAGEVAR